MCAVQKQDRQKQTRYVAQTAKQQNEWVEEEGSNWPNKNCQYELLNSLYCWPKRTNDHFGGSRHGNIPL